MSLKFPNEYKGILPLGMNFTVSFSTWSVALTAQPSKAMFYRYLPSPLTSSVHPS